MTQMITDDGQGTQRADKQAGSADSAGSGRPNAMRWVPGCNRRWAVARQSHFADDGLELVDNLPAGTGADGLPNTRIDCIVDDANRSVTEEKVHAL